MRVALVGLVGQGDRKNFMRRRLSLARISSRARTKGYAATKNSLLFLQCGSLDLGLPLLQDWGVLFLLGHLNEAQVSLGLLALDLRAPNDTCDVLYGLKCYALQRCHQRTLEDVTG